MILCAVDLETSGLKQDSARILEIALSLYDTVEKQSFETFSTWVWDHSYPPPFQEALAVNGLTVSGLQKRGLVPYKAFEVVLRYFNRADAVIAHNGTNFDKPILEKQASLFSVNLPTKVWIDTRFDFDYPVRFDCRSLVHLCANHNIVVKNAHRALNDVQLMLELCQFYDLNHAFERAKSPLIRVEATVPILRNAGVKTLRFRWDPKLKVWFKMIRELDFEKEFKVFEQNIGYKIRRANATF